MTKTKFIDKGQKAIRRQRGIFLIRKQMLINYIFIFVTISLDVIDAFAISMLDINSNNFIIFSSTIQLICLIFNIVVFCKIIKQYSIYIYKMLVCFALIFSVSSALGTIGILVLMSVKTNIDLINT
jgi:hypothetical protein